MDTSSAPSDSECRLPVFISDGSGKVQGAFIEYPSGAMTIGAGASGGEYYDRTHARWLPVTRNAVSPDESEYAYLDRKIPGTVARQDLHIVDVVSGHEKLYPVAAAGEQAAYTVVSFDAKGVWLAYAGYEGPTVGLFLFDLGSRRLTDFAGPRQVFNPVAGRPGIFWFTDYGAQPEPQTEGMGGYYLARVQRLTIAGPTVESWLARDRTSIQVIGVDANGFPVVADGSGVWLMTAPNKASRIDLPQGFFGVVSADRHRTWLGGMDGVYLYTSGGELTKVTGQAASPAGTCA